MEQKKKRIKSPNYPAFSLPKAISKIKVLYEKDGKAGAPKDVTLGYLNIHSIKSGVALRTIAALKQYGLIKEITGRIILSDEALDLLLYPENDIRYINILKEIALKPDIYRKLFERYKAGLPSTATLKAELLRDDDFNPKVVDNFIEDFKETIEIAHLYDDKAISLKEKIPIKESGQIETSMDTLLEKKEETIEEKIQSFGLQTFPIPLSKRKKAAIVFESLPIEKKDIETIKKWLDLVEGSLTEAE